MTDKFNFMTENKMIKEHHIMTYNICQYCGNFHQMSYICENKQIISEIEEEAKK